MKTLLLSALAVVGLAATAGTASAQYGYYGGHHHHQYYRGGYGPGYGAYYPGYGAYYPGYYRPGVVVAAPPVVAAPLVAPGYAPYVPYQPGVSFGFTIR